MKKHWRATVYTFRTFLAAGTGQTQVSNREITLHINELRAAVHFLSQVQTQPGRVSNSSSLPTLPAWSKRSGRARRKKRMV
jgi:hypothetical protein